MNSRWTTIVGDHVTLKLFKIMGWVKISGWWGFYACGKYRKLPKTAENKRKLTEKLSKTCKFKYMDIFFQR